MFVKITYFFISRAKENNASNSEDAKQLSGILSHLLHIMTSKINYRGYQLSKLSKMLN